MNHPNDRGGPTKYGITQETLSQFRGYPASVNDVRLLTEQEAMQIYETNYIKRPGFEHIQDPNLLDLVVDCAVNHGVNRATKWLQEVIGVASDGIIGPQTRAAIDEADPQSAYKRLLAKRVRFFGRLITGNPSQAVFAAGWLNRCSQFIER